MSVNIRIPNSKGDKQMCVSASEAKNVVADCLNKGMIVAVNHEIVNDSAKVEEGDNVVVLPRISGG